METRIPDIELFMVFKWALVLMFVSALTTFASLVVKRYWYGNAKHNRRADDDSNTRGVLERFFELKEASNKVLVELKNEMGNMSAALKANSEMLQRAVDNWECKYPEHGGRR